MQVFTGVKKYMSSRMETRTQTRISMQMLACFTFVLAPALSHVTHALEPVYDPTTPAPALIRAENNPKKASTKSFLWEVKPASKPASSLPAPNSAAKAGVAASAVNAVSANPASANSKVLYLFGTIHVGNKSFYPLPAAVEDAFKRSSVLVLEADISKADNVNNIQKMIFYEPPDALHKHISGFLYTRLMKQAARLQLPPDGVTAMKPYMIGGLLSISEFTRLGYDVNEGVEGYLLSLANAGKKPVLELESQLGQIKMLNDMSPALQEAFLDNAVTTLEDGKTLDQVLGMVNAWQSGDVAAMQEVTADANKGARQSAALDEVLLYNRHAGMLKKIESYLLQDKTHFVAVGSLHLLGPRGLIELLKSKGYNVKQLGQTTMKVE